MKVTLQVWVSGLESPTISHEADLAFEPLPSIKDVVIIAGKGFEVSHREFEKEGACFVGNLVMKRVVGTVKEAMKVGDLLDKTPNLQS